MRILLQLLLNRLTRKIVISHNSKVGKLICERHKDHRPVRLVNNAGVMPMVSICEIIKHAGTLRKSVIEELEIGIQLLPVLASIGVSDRVKAKEVASTSLGYFP